MVRRSGFTLVELLTIISIVTLVTGFSLASLASARARARDDVRVADLKAIQSALELYRFELDQASSQDLFAYPRRYFENSQYVGNGVYPSSSTDAKIQKEGTLFTRHLAQTPRDQLYLKNYVYYAPGCIRPGFGTPARPVIVTPAASDRFFTATQLKQMSVDDPTRPCPKGSGWVPYVLYVLLERPITGSARQSSLTNLAISSDRAIVYAPAEPLYIGNENNDDGGRGGIIQNVSHCYPATVAGCPDGYTTVLVELPEDPREDGFDGGSTGTGTGGSGNSPSPSASSPSGTDSQANITTDDGGKVGNTNGGSTSASPSPASQSSGNDNSITTSPSPNQQGSSSLRPPSPAPSSSSGPTSGTTNPFSGIEY